MSRNLNRLAIGVFVTGIFAATGAFAQNATTFGDKLGFMPRAATNQAFISGTGQVSATLEGSTLSITGEFEGMSGSVTGVSVHNAPMGQVGPEFATLEFDGDNTGTFSGEIELTEEQLAELEDSAIYVVVQSDRSETGELRAWLVAGNV